MALQGKAGLQITGQWYGFDLLHDDAERFLAAVALVYDLSGGYGYLCKRTD